MHRNHRVAIVGGGKACSRCGLWKDMSEYALNSASLGGRLARCKACTRELYQLRLQTVVCTTTTKTCRTCGLTLDATHFGRNGSSSDGLRNHCKSCCARKIASYRREHKDKTRESNLKCAYGLTLADYNTMLDNQGGLCAVCGRSPDGGVLQVDHCHRTGIVRGLLCRACNVALGMMEDDESRIQALQYYVRVHSVQTNTKVGTGRTRKDKGQEAGQQEPGVEDLGTDHL